MMEFSPPPSSSPPPLPSSSFSGGDEAMLDVLSSSQEEKDSSELFSYPFDSQHHVSLPGSSTDSYFPSSSNHPQNHSPSSSSSSHSSSPSLRSLPIPCPEKFPWGELRDLCEDCEAHLVILKSLQNQGFPACFFLPSSSSSDVFFTLNFPSLHALALYATRPIKGRRQSIEGSHDLHRQSDRKDVVRSFLDGGGIERGVEENEEGRATPSFSSFFKSDFLQAKSSNTTRRGRRRPREVLYSFQGRSDTEVDRERKQGEGKLVAISWHIVDFIVNKLRAVLPRVFSSSLFPRPEVLMELAILAYRREDRRRREREARRSLDHRKGGGVFIHSAMTDVHPFSYDATKQRFQSTPLQPASLSSLGKLSCDSTVIGDMYNRRFHVLHERCQLHPLLSLHGRDASDGGLSEGGGGRSAAAGGGGGTAYIFRNEEDHDEDHLNHTANRKRVVCDVDAASRRSGHRQLLLGVLGRDANKDLALQGLFSDVRLKFEKDCIPRPGLFLEGHIVLADGCFKEKDDDFFHVCDLSHPPRYPCSDRLSLDCSSSSSSLYGGDDENMKMSGRDLQDEVNEDRMDGEDFFSFSGDTFISKQQGSSMFGGLLTLSQLEALKTWREVEEEKEEDSQAIQEKEEDMNEKLLRIFGVGEGWKNLASREGHRKEEEKDGDDGDKENHLVGDSRRRTREREEHEGGDQERGGRSREGGGGGNRKGREEEGEGEREGRQERYLERRVDDDMGAGNKREEEEEEEEEQRDPMAWVIISECHFDQTVDLRLLESIFSTLESHEEFPSGFVFLGNFSSSLSTPEATYSGGFDSLFKLLSTRFRSFLTRCHFVFVPGPEDPCFARESLPRLPLTPPFTSDFQQRLEHLIPACKGKIFFTTSPCRIRHFTSSMIFFRHDVFKALSRDALSTKRGNKQGNNTSSSSPSFSVADMLYNTIVGQAHLCPMTADHRLIKHRDQSLGLFPMPDLVFVCDKSAPPMTKTDPNLPKEFIFANADSPFSVSRSFYIYEMSSHRLTKYCVPTGEGEK